MNAPERADVDPDIFFSGNIEAVMYCGLQDMILTHKKRVEEFRLKYGEDPFTGEAIESIHAKPESKPTE